MKKPDKKGFKSYPTRSITLSNETWLEFKQMKENFGKNWEAFIKEEIIKQYKLLKDNSNE